LNSRSYWLSQDAKACSHFQASEPSKDSVFGVEVPGSLTENPDALRQISVKYHEYLEA